MHANGLMSAARAWMAGSQRSMVSALAVVPLAAAVPAAHAGAEFDVTQMTNGLVGAVAQTSNGGSFSSPTSQIILENDTVRFARTASFSGPNFSTFTPGVFAGTFLFTSGEGGLTGPLTPGDRFIINWDFTIAGQNVTNLSWQLNGSVSTTQEFLSDSRNGAGLGTFSSLDEGQSPIVLTVGQSAFATGFGLSLEFTSNVPVETFGSLDFTIPPNSVSITYVPVPEPATLALLLVGAGGVVMGRRQRTATAL